jgi:hypothetical protein
VFCQLEHKLSIICYRYKIIGKTKVKNCNLYLKIHPNLIIFKRTKVP